MTGSYEIAKEVKASLEATLDSANNALRAIPGISSGAMGLTPDSVKASAAYRDASARYHAAHMALRAFNTWFLKNHGAQYRTEMRAKRRA